MWERFFDDETKIALVTLVVAVALLFGVPKDYQDKIVEVVLAVFGLGAILVGAKGYKKGKLNEGTVPDGAKPANGGININLPGASVSEELGVPVPPPADQSPPPGGGTTAAGWLALLLVPVLAMMTGGCASTSAVFRKGAANAGPFICEQLRYYIDADSSLSESDKSGRLARLQAMEIATADADRIDAQQVADAWYAVRALYVDYVRADTSLDVDQQTVFLQVADQFDRLVAEELKRRSLMWRIPPPS